jgi:hypothetical protein
LNWFLAVFRAIGKAAFSFLFAGPPEGFAVGARLGLAPGHDDAGLDGVMATKLRIDHRQLGVSEKEVTHKIINYRH